MNQACLRRLQLAQRLFGRIARRTDCLLGPLALRDVGKDQHEATARHRIAAHFDDAAIGSRALDPLLSIGFMEAPAQFGFEVGRVLAALGKIVEILDIARPLGEEALWQIEYLLEIAVPRGEPQPAVEHHDTIAHVVEGNAKLGLAVTQLLEQPCILDRDCRLVRERRNQFDLLVRERIDSDAVKTENANQSLLAQKRYAQHGPETGDLLDFRVGVFSVLQYIGNMDGAKLQLHPAGCRSATWCGRMTGEVCLSLL